MRICRYNKEYKQVSVLCGGLAAARTLAQQLDAETMDELMHEFLSLAERTLKRFEGTVTQRHGTGFMALFGAPHAHEDHVRRAVLAAIELLKAVQERPDRSQWLAIGLSIHTGPVVVGGLSYAPQQIYTALGTTTDIALRLQQQAPPGALLISEPSYELVATEIQVEPHGELDDEPNVAVYQVQSIHRRWGGVPQRRIVSRFVGRDWEFGMLHRRYW